MIKDPYGQKLSQRLCNNLQNTYLKGINYLMTENLNNRQCPNKFLEEYDLQLWNNHIYNLSDLNIKKLLMKQLIINHIEN